MSSPCTLVTNEVPLFSTEDWISVVLIFTGYGEGPAMRSGGAGAVQVVHSVFVNDPVDKGWRLRILRQFSEGTMVLRGGDNQLIFHMDGKERQVSSEEWNAKDTVLQLRLAYE